LRQIKKRGEKGRKEEKAVRQREKEGEIGRN